MKQKNRSVDLSLRDDPRVRDPALERRYRALAAQEVLHQAYGCALWSMERLGKLGDHAETLRRAGDKYQKVVLAGRRGLEFDPDLMPAEIKSQTVETVRNATKKWREAQQAIRAGLGKEGILTHLAVDDLCLDEMWPTTEKQRQRVIIGLTRLAHFFGYWNKPST